MKKQETRTKHKNTFLKRVCVVQGVHVFPLSPFIFIYFPHLELFIRVDGYALKILGLCVKEQPSKTHVHAPFASDTYTNKSAEEENLSRKNRAHRRRGELVNGRDGIHTYRLVFASLYFSDAPRVFIKSSERVVIKWTTEYMNECRA